MADVVPLSVLRRFSALRDKEQCRPVFGHGIYLRPFNEWIQRSTDGRTWQTADGGRIRPYSPSDVFAFGYSPI